MWVVAAVGCGSSGGAEPGALGLVAYSRSGGGELVVLDIARGAETVIDDAGPFGTLSFSRDGDEIAYVNSGREVFIASLEADVRAAGETGWYMANLRWEVGGWLWYPEGTNSRSFTIIVPPGSAAPRQLGTTRYVPVAGSPVESRLAFFKCSEAQPLVCDLIIERPDGSDRMVLASAVVAAGARFTPDGLRVVVAEQRDDGSRAISRRIDGAGGEIDLGPADGQMFESGPPPGLSLFSPDGSEILSLDGANLIALHLDGSGARTIAEPGPTRPWHAGFTPAGEVLFMQITNTEEPPDDTPEFAYTIRIAGVDGTVRTLRELDPACSIAMFSSSVATVSADGSLLAYDCGIVQRIADGAIVAELPAGRPLGFTPDGSTLFLSGTTLHMVDQAGDFRELGETYGSESQDVEGLQAAYLDPAR
jgi:hypothetical protein